MRMRLVGSSAIAVMLVTASCRFPSTQGGPSCNDDPALCPPSTKTATSVTCDCTCTIGAIEGEDHYNGRVAVCLPAALNGTIASGEQQIALAALDARTFDQRIFGYCSQEVAPFLRAAIKAQARVRLAACAVPVSCECTTKGTERDSAACHTECAEVACDPRSCRAVLQASSKLDMSSCGCSRAAVCGDVQPPEDAPRLCRDWLTAIKPITPITPEASQSHPSHQ